MYKNFIIKISVILIILFSVYSIFVLNFKMDYMDPEYPMWQEVKDRSLNKTNKVEDIIMLGDSRAKAGFKPTVLKNISSINLSLGGATPIEGYYTIKRYLENNPYPKNILISYTPTHLSATDGCYFARTVPFDFLEDNEYREVEKMALKFNQHYILKQNKSYLDYKFPMIYGNHFSNGILHMRWLTNNIVYKYSKQEKGYHYFGVKDSAIQLNTEANENIFTVSKLYDYYFKKTLALISNNTTVYFYIMPFNKSSFKVVNKSYISEYEKYLISLSNQYNMNICNKVFFMPNTSFGDPSHLYSGVEENTFKILDCVYKNKLTLP